MDNYISINDKNIKENNYKTKDNIFKARLININLLKDAYISNLFININILIMDI